MIIFTRSAVLAVLCLSACTTPEEPTDDAGSRADAGRSDAGSTDAGTVDSLCPELDSLQNLVLNPNGTLVSTNIQAVMTSRLLAPMPLNNLIARIAQADASACQMSGTQTSCTCPGGGTVVYVRKMSTTLTEERAVATDCGLTGQLWSGRSCKRQTIQAPLTLTTESYQYSQGPQDGGTQIALDTQYSIKQTGAALTLVEDPRQRLVVSDGSVTVQTDGNVAGPWKIFDRQGTWDCGTLANASGVCTGPAGATIPWTK